MYWRISSASTVDKRASPFFILGSILSCANRKNADGHHAGARGFAVTQEPVVLGGDHLSATCHSGHSGLGGAVRKFKPLNSGTAILFATKGCRQV